MYRTSLFLVVTSIISVHGFAMDLQGESDHEAPVLLTQFHVAEDDVEMESRIFTSGGGLNLNSSTLTVLAGLTAALLLGLLALLAFAPRASTTSGGNLSHNRRVDQLCSRIWTVLQRVRPEGEPRLRLLRRLLQEEVRVWTSRW